MCSRDLVGFTIVEVEEMASRAGCPGPEEAPPAAER